VVIESSYWRMGLVSRDVLALVAMFDVVEVGV